MQQPQSRPLLGDSVSSTTSPTARRSNPVAVLTQQQLQQLQQLQSQNCTGQSVTFALQQPSATGQDQANGSTVGNHILYLNQLNQLNPNALSATAGMGLPSGTPTFGVGLNMGLPLSLLNSGLSPLASNTGSAPNSLLNLNIPGLNSGLTAINPSLNHLNTLGTNISSNLPPESISNGLSNLGQDLGAINSSLGRINALNSANLASGLGGLGTGLATVNSSLTGLHTTLNQNLANLNAANNQSISNSGGNSTWNSLGSNINLSTSGLNTALTQQGLGKPFNPTSSSSFPLQSIQSIQSIAPHIVGSNITNLASSNSIINSSGNSSTASTFSTTCSGPILATTANAAGQLGLMSSSLANVLAEQGQNSTQNGGFQRQFSNQGLGANPNTLLSNIKTMQSIQNQNSTSPGSPFSIPMKSPAPNVAPPTPSPSPNRLLLRSPAPNVLQTRNSPSPISTSNANFNMQLTSPLQSPIGQIQSPVPSSYPPAKSPHNLGVGPLSNKSPVPGGSPGPAVQGMQVLQIIQGAQQGFHQAPAQLVTRTPIFGGQQIQLAPSKSPKQPPQILPKPTLQQQQQQQTTVPQPAKRVTTTIASQITQTAQPQLVIASPQPNTQTTATMIPTAQGLLQLNQVLPTAGPVIVQQQPGGVQLILRTPTNAQPQTHTAQLTQQQLVRVVAAQGMHLQGITPTFFAVPNGFTSPTPHVIRQTPTSLAPQTTGNNGPIVIQNTLVQNAQPQVQPQPITQINTPNNVPTVVDQSLLPPPKKKAKKKKKVKKKEDEPPKLDLASIMKISGIGDDDDMFDSDIPEPVVQAPQQDSTIMPSSNQIPVTSSLNNQLAQPVPHPVVTPNEPNNLPNSAVTQIQTPSSNTISGTLRLSVGEDGRIVLHHTPEPNQPEMDQATAQALIRSLTQSGQNSQIFSQLLQGPGIIQINPSKPKVEKAPPTNTGFPCPIQQQQQSMNLNQNNSQNPPKVVLQRKISVDPKKPCLVRQKANLQRNVLTSQIGINQGNKVQCTNSNEAKMHSITLSSSHHQNLVKTTQPNQNVTVQRNVQLIKTTQSENGMQFARTLDQLKVEQMEQPKQEPCLDSQAASILNGAPKITPEILNALSNLNPNDQLLIANANGQMQVISQQLLQQFLSGQLNNPPSQQTLPQNQNQNQQKIIIGEPDSNNQNLQGLQINTPTSQIIVNSSGGAPTIQNNIQNIVVQAAPSNIPQQIQIQNSGFPSQFIDNFNQQQIRNLGNNQTNNNNNNNNQNNNCTNKKAKVIKKKQVISVSQGTMNIQLGKSMTAGLSPRPNIVVTSTKVHLTTTTTTTTTTSIAANRKCDSPKIANLPPQDIGGKVEQTTHAPVMNGPLRASSPNCQQSPTSTTGSQMMQRIQTIQLPFHKQQALRNIQAQIQGIIAKKPITPADQELLQKLSKDQAKILATGKVLSTTSHPISSESQSTQNVNAAISSASANFLNASVSKGQTSMAQGNLQSVPVSVAAPCIPSIRINPQPTIASSTNNLYLNNQTPQLVAHKPQLVAKPLCPQQQPQQPAIHCLKPLNKIHKTCENDSSSILTQANVNDFEKSFVGNVTSSAPNFGPKLPLQQSTQCQTDTTDVKPDVHLLNPSIKPDLTPQGQIQLQSNNHIPAKQVMEMTSSPVKEAPICSNDVIDSAIQHPNLATVDSKLSRKEEIESQVDLGINKKEAFEAQLKSDQNGACNPDVHTPFQSKVDACKRLLRYHVFDDPVFSSKDLEKADDIFEDTARHLLCKFKSMVNKYSYLLLMDSMRETRTSELVMIERMFNNDEQMTFNMLREQEAKANEEFKKEEKLLVPKIEPDLTDVDNLIPTLTNASVKLELEDDFPDVDVDSKVLGKLGGADYDEWLEIQKELSVYASSSDLTRCRVTNVNNGSSSVLNNQSLNSGAANLFCGTTRSSKFERIRANGDYHNHDGINEAASVVNNNCDLSSMYASVKSAFEHQKDLERDLLDDSESLDGLTLYNQGHCPSSLDGLEAADNTNNSETDDITAQVQSAIDSILSLKKRPSSNNMVGQANTGNSQSKDEMTTDQVVRNILSS